MDDVKKWGGIAGGILLGLMFAAFEFGKHIAIQEIAAKPPVRDTVKVTDTLVVERPVAVIKTITVIRHDTVYSRPGIPTYVARADTVIQGTKLSLGFCSPEPIPPEAHFCDITVDPPDTLIVIRPETITVTKTVVEKEFPIEYVVGTAAAFFLLGALCL